MENWKDIENYEGIYQVSDLGRVKRLDGYVATGIKHSSQRKLEGRILKPHLKRNGYLAVDLSKNHQVKTINVHRLVAKAFLKPKAGCDCVNHINAIKTDNRAVNLEWCTSKENSQSAVKMGLYAPPNKKTIKCIELNKVFSSSYEAAEYINEHYFQNSKQVKNIACKIRSAVLGYQSVSYGFHWQHL